MLGEAFGGPAADDRLEKFQELGGGAGEVAALLEERTDGLGHGVGVGMSEGQTHFILGATQGGAGGHGPGEGVGGSPGGWIDVGHTGEGDSDGGAEGRKDFGPSL